MILNDQPIIYICVIQLEYRQRKVYTCIFAAIFQWDVSPLRKVTVDEQNELDTCSKATVFTEVEGNA